MRTDPKQPLGQAEKLLRAGKPRQAADLLAQVDGDLLAPSACACYYLLRGEARLFLGMSDHDDIDRAIEYYRTSGENFRYAHAKYLKGWQLQLLGELAEAKETLNEAYAAFLRVNAGREATRALNRLSSIAFQQGEMEHACGLVKRCIERYIESGDTDKAAIMNGNSALLHWRCGAVGESLRIYRRIESSLDDLPVQNRTNIRLGHALALALSGDRKEAVRRLTALKRQLKESSREYFIALEYLGWVWLLDGQYAKAEETLSAGLKIALEETSEPSHLSQIKRLLADLYAATGEMDKAETCAAEAMAVAEKINERIEVAACCRVLAQVEQYRGHGARARDWYRKAADLFVQIGARYETAVTRMAAGLSGLYAEKERLALLFLAREYFLVEKLDHLVAELDRRSTPPAVDSAASVSEGSAPMIVGASPAMRKLVEFAANVAPSDMAVLLTGETGTGKDLFARYIHYLSGRPGQFVSVNAAAIPASMIEAELFGHGKGSFTGADTERAGLFEQADRGTFYLNEIGDASPEFQAKLLEVLDQRTVRRLGDNRTRRVDFRLIAATNHDLQLNIKTGRFRLDLYHRLKEIALMLPPLAKRREDIHDLVRWFLNDLGVSTVDRAAVRRLADTLGLMPWPGNVRELRAVVNGLAVACRGDVAAMCHRVLVDNAINEEDQLRRVLDRTGWNRSRAAQILGVTEGTVRHRIKKYGLRLAADCA